MTRAEPLVLGVDQGTSATKAILVDAGGEPVASATAPLPVRHPAPGRVEQDGEELWRSVREAVSRCLAGVPPGRVAAVGLSVQRESLILWDRDTGEPLGPLVSWQDRRGTDLCARLAADGAAPLVRRISGLPLDPMFSASRAAWLLARHRARDGLCLGTVDSWLLFKMGGGHVVEVGSASRTQLLDVRRRRWSGELLDLFGIPAETLPRVVPSSGAHADAAALHPSLAGVPVGAVLGDSHAALFAHAAGEPGRVKVTYGTGSSVMGLTGHAAEPDAPDTGRYAPSAEPDAPAAGLDAPSGGPDAPSGDGLCLTIGWDDGRPAYALEGNILSAGATVTWLAGLLATEPAEVARLATLGRRGRLHIVPAFGGLGAPWWDDRAQAIMTGLGLDSRREDLARAAVDSIGLQVGDVVSAMEHAAGPVTELLADGGPTANADLMQWQADVTGLPVRVARRPELSALGAAHLAGTASGVWSRRELSGLPRHGRRYTPGLSSRERHRALAEWHSAVARARHRTSRSGGAEAEASDRGS